MLYLALFAALCYNIVIIDYHEKRWIYLNSDDLNLMKTMIQLEKADDYLVWNKEYGEKSTNIIKLVKSLRIVAFCVTVLSAVIAAILVIFLGERMLYLMHAFCCIFSISLIIWALLAGLCSKYQVEYTGYGRYQLISGQTQGFLTKFEILLDKDEFDEFETKIVFVALAGYLEEAEKIYYNNDKLMRWVRYYNDKKHKSESIENDLRGNTELASELKKADEQVNKIVNKVLNNEKVLINKKNIEVMQ